MVLDDEVMGAFRCDQIEGYARVTGRTSKEVEAIVRTFRMRPYFEMSPWRY
jgi:hypothetical protein